MDLANLLVSAGVGAAASLVTSYATAHFTARQELRRWKADMAEKYGALVAEQPARAQALARQFAVGVLIVERGDPAQRDKIFVAPHTRIIAGRQAENEIVLDTLAASRKHFAISADADSVYVEDLGSNNGTLLNDQRVQGRTPLRAGDVIRIDATFRIEFQPLASNM